jgi:hypothetical protein
MDLTLIQQGTFTSTGANVYIPLRSGVDWMDVYNVAQAAATQLGPVKCKFYWQYGFPAGSQWAEAKLYNAVNNNNITYTTTGGFTYYDLSGNRYGNVNATITAVSTAATPVATNTGTNGLVAGNVVRLFNVVGAPQLSGLDFTVGYGTLSTTTFSLDYMSTLATAGTTASWAQVNFDPLYYPTRRYITSITQAASAVIQFSVTHGFQVGQTIRIDVPAAYGMTQINGLLGTITAVNTATTAATGNTVTVNINSTNFTAFAFPTNTAGAFTPAQAVPVGEDTASALISNVNILTDATVNNGAIGMILQGGAGFPGGASSDVLYWKAGKSFSGGQT